MIKPNTVKGGVHKNGTNMYICRAHMGDGVHPGKLYGKTCYIGWGGKEHAVTKYEYFTEGKSLQPNQLPCNK